MKKVIFFILILFVTIPNAYPSKFLHTQIAYKINELSRCLLEINKDLILYETLKILDEDIGIIGREDQRTFDDLGLDVSSVILDTLLEEAIVKAVINIYINNLKGF